MAKVSPKFVAQKMIFLRENISEKWNCRIFQPHCVSISKNLPKKTRSFHLQNSELPGPKDDGCTLPKICFCGPNGKGRVVNRRSFFTWQTFSNMQKNVDTTLNQCHPAVASALEKKQKSCADLTPLFGKLKSTLRNKEVSNHQDENQLHHDAPSS